VDSQLRILQREGVLSGDCPLLLSPPSTGNFAPWLSSCFDERAVGSVYGRLGLFEEYV